MPYASATFPWFRLGRQVHVRGPVTKVSAEVTADYWRHRPRGSQLGAWASHQSHPIASRAALLGPIGRRHARFADLDEVPVPPNWGGYLIAPDVVEFWQGRENRVHNRIRVTEAASSGFSRSAALLVRGDRRLTPLRTPDFRRLWLAGIPTVIGANLTIFAVPVQLYALTAELRLRRAFRDVRARPAGGVRAVGRRVGGRDGPARAADHHVVRVGGGVGAAVAAGRAVRSTTCGWCCACCRCSRRSTRSTSPPGRRRSLGSCRATNCPRPTR